MAEAAKSKTEYTAVTMADGRVVQFAGKRKVMKDTLIDESKIVLDGSGLLIQPGAIKVRMDFVNGESRDLDLPLGLLAQFAGHGGQQKFGDELASSAANPLSPEDMVVAIDDLYSVIEKGQWGRSRESGGGGVSGASIVVQAICQVTGKDVNFVKEFLQKKLDADPELTRRALYNSFRVIGTKTGDIIKKMEEAKMAKTAAVDADEALAGITD